MKHIDSTLSFNGVRVTSTGTASLGVIARDSSGRNPMFVRVAVTASAYVRFSLDASAATSTDILMNPGGAREFNVSSLPYVSVASVTGTSVAVISSLERGGWDAFSPASFFAAGEQGVWLDPSDFATMFQDSAGTTPVTAVGQPVGKILDKSGRGNHATQATGVSQPLLQQDGSGLYYLAFDGSNDSLATASIDFTATNKMVVGAGIRKNSDAATGILMELSTNVASAGAFYITAPETTSASGRYGFRMHMAADAATRGYQDTARAAPATNVITMEMDGSSLVLASAMVVRINAASMTTTPTADPAATGNFGNFPLYIGRRAGATLPFNGRIYSMVIRGAAVTTAQRTSLEAYMNSKTGAY